MSKQRICANCEFSHAEMVQTQQGFQKIMICMHDDCLDLVSGDHIPCGASRREDVYCGVGGKYYKQKAKESPIKAVMTNDKGEEKPVEATLIQVERTK
jgi:hypothetical protein